MTAIIDKAEVFEVVQCKSEKHWLVEREKYVTGSTAADICGVGYGSQLKQWMQRTGRMDPPDLSGNEAVQLGKKLERAILRLYEQQKQRKLAYPKKHMLFISTRYPGMACTLDADDEGNPVDGKNVGLRQSQHWSDTECPDAYRIQMAVQMAVLGATWSSLAALIGGQRFQVVDIQRSEQLIEAVYEQTREFLACVERDEPPAVDGSDDTRDALKALYPDDEIEVVHLPAEAADWYAEVEKAAEAEKEAKARRQEFENLIRGEMKGGTHGYLPDGSLAFTLTKQERKEHMVKASSTRVLRRKTL